MILSKGLSFVPTKRINNNKILTDLDNFEQQLINRATPFQYDIPRHPFVPNKTSPSTSSIPEQTLTTINQYISNCKEEIINSTRSTNLKDNLNPTQRKVLNELKKRKDIIIKKADKGDTIVVETVENYTKDGLTHLSNSKYYQRLESDLNTTIAETIAKFLNNAHQRGMIDKDLYTYLLPPKPFRTPLIYFLKKLHKTPIAVRPIVSHINSPTSNISAFLDKLLKPIVKEIPHILTSSKTLINELRSITLTPGSILVTLDVTSLYPNIPIHESILVILDFIKQQHNPTHPPICILTQLFNFVLNYNCFNFANLFFLQVHGIAMGTKLAPNYANLFMANLESKSIFTHNKLPVFYRRYIDDIFFVWNHDPLELDTFIDYLNTIHPTIKFTKSTSTTMITYLDLDIYLKENKLHTKTHFKSTNTFSYLHGHSNHPKSTFTGVHKGENIRILRNTSEETNYNSTMSFINTQFKRRQYPKHLTTAEHIPFSDRDQYLNTSPRDSTYSTNFITTFDPSIKLREHLTADWPRLSSHQELRRIFQDPPNITHKHSPNLSQLLVRAKLNYHIDTQLPISNPPDILHITYPAKNIFCRNTQCGTCPQLNQHSHYSSYQTKQYFSIPDVYSCDTTQAIYLLECKICNKQYIGETHNTIRNRMKHHRNMSNTATNRPIYSHILHHSTDFSVFSITIIDKIVDTISRKQKELEYISLLKTKVPYGLNVIAKNNK